MMHLYGQFPTDVFWHLPFILADKVMHRAFAGKLCDNVYMTLLTTLLKSSDSQVPEQVCSQCFHYST